MEKIVLRRNVVVNGRFNPVSFDKYFFIKNQIISESDFDSMKHQPVFNAVNVHVSTDKYELVITPNQIVIHGTNLDSNDIDLGSKLKAVLDLSDSSDFAAFGANFEWMLQLSGEKEVHKTSKAFFFNETTTMIGDYFNSEDAQFGFYASKNILGVRLKLNVKPIQGTFHGDDELKDGLHYAFNFHCDQGALELEQFLSSYKKFENESTEMINVYN